MVGGLLYREPVPVDEAICRNCQAHDPPMTVNRVTVSVAINVLRREGSPKVGEFLKTYSSYLSNKQPPSIFRRFANYVAAMTYWAAHGFPVRSKDEIEYLLNTYCLKCTAYDAANQVCTECGCPAKTAGFPIFNKLAIATESCPRGYFKGKQRMADKLEVEDAYLLLLKNELSKLEELIGSIKQRDWNLCNITPIICPNSSAVCKPYNCVLSDVVFSKHIGLVNVVMSALDAGKNRIAVFHSGYPCVTSFSALAEHASTELIRDWDMIVVQGGHYVPGKWSSEHFDKTVQVFEPVVYFAKTQVLCRLLAHFLSTWGEFSITPAVAESLNVFAYRECCKPIP